MSCFHPLIAFPSGVTKNGKTKYVPIKATDEAINYSQDKLYDSGAILVPCGKCIGCRLDYSREWAARCMLELKSHDSAYFLTLTYNDDAIPKSEYIGPNGEKLVSYTVRKDHFTNFVKRLREYFPEDKIRIFGCSEYGSDSMRPHYHLIVFGLHLDPKDLKRYKQNDDGDWYYKSEKLNRVWSYHKEIDGKDQVFPYGYVVIGEVNWRTCAYVARYTAKKCNTMDAAFYERFGLEKPFIRMSRNPGLGKKYLEEHPDLFKSTSIPFKVKDSVKRSPIPKYYYRLLEAADPDMAAALKMDRQISGSVYSRAVNMASQKSYLETLKDAEEILLSKSKSLFRNEI